MSSPPGHHFDDYLRTHLAAARVGCTIAERIAAAWPSEMTTGLVAEIDADRATLQRVVDARQVGSATANRLGAVGGWLTSAIDRVRARRSARAEPTVVLELETLAGGIVAKRSMWIAVQASRIPIAEDLPELIRRADTQLRRVAGLHRQAATTAFATATSVPVGALPPEGHPDAATGPTESPSDNTTLSSVVDSFAKEGFDGDFWTEPEGRVRCDACDAVHPAGALYVYAQRRLEGASDPADMAVVVAAACPACSAKATLVLTYGPMADAVDTDVLAALAPRAPAATDPTAPAPPIA